MYKDMTKYRKGNYIVGALRALATLCDGKMRVLIPEYKHNGKYQPAFIATITIDYIVNDEAKSPYMREA